MTESLCSTMNVRSPKPWNSKHGVTQYFRFTIDMFFVFKFCMFDVCMIGKNYCIVYLYAQINNFRSVHKILIWIGSSDFNKSMSDV